MLIFFFCYIFSLLWSHLIVTHRNAQQESQLGCQGQPVRATSHKLRRMLPSGAVGNQTMLITVRMRANFC